MILNEPWFCRGALTALAVIVVGLGLSAYLAIIGYTIWEAKRYGAANTVLYGVDGALTYPAHLAAGLRGGGSGGGEDGISVRVLSVLGAALFWGAGTGALSYLKSRHKTAHWVVAIVLVCMALWSATAGYESVALSR